MGMERFLNIILLLTCLSVEWHSVIVTARVEVEEHFQFSYSSVPVSILSLHYHSRHVLHHCMEEVSISKGDVLSLNLLSPSLLSFTSCSATSGGNGLFVSEETVEQIIYYPSWNSLFGSSYSSSLEDVYLGSPSTSTIPLQHLCFPPSEGAQRIT